MKKKLAIGGVILALIVGIAVWVIRGEEIKKKAAQHVTKAAVETAVETALEKATEKAEDKLIKETLKKLNP